MRLRSVPLALGVVGLAVTAGAWPGSLTQPLTRDARRLVPRSLALLIADREARLLDESRRLPPEISRALAADQVGGRLSAPTLEAVDALVTETIGLLKQGRVTEGIARFGALLRIPADLSDPALCVGAEGFPPGVVREYYAFVEANLNKVPVVLDERAALTLTRPQLASYWQSLLAKSRSQAPVIRLELFRDGRLVDHSRIDYRSPVFAVGALSYSRAVTAVAATWLVAWREARGDLTRMPTAREVRPSEGAPAAVPRLSPEVRTP
jgi:hypothetical protein